MQINPFGFPLGAGMQSASANGAASLGFADALGFAIEGGAAQQPMALKASATPPPHFGPKLAQTLLEQAQLAAEVPPRVVPGILPGLQQPTSLSELMATAAKLPGADQMPAAATVPAAVEQPGPVAVDADPNAAALEIASPAKAPAAAPEIVASPAAAPEIVASSTASPAAEIVAPGTAPLPTVPAQAEVALEPESDALPDALTPAPAETAPAKPQKAPRGGTAAAEADPSPLDDAKPTIPAEMPASAVMPQPIASQPIAAQPAAARQTAPREPSANAQGGSAVSKTSKVTAQAVPTSEAAQAASVTGTADFALAVAARTGSPGSQSNPDGQPQPETMPAVAARIDAAAPILPQHIAATTSADPTRATAPIPAEPVIEARAGHLGQSLGVEIARKVELGEETLRIRLNPIELGRIEVTLAFDDKGSLQATVRTESAQAMELLRQDAPDLARTLDQAGVRTDAQSFRFESRTGDGGGQQAQQQQSQNRGRFASSDDDAGTPEPIYRPIRNDGQVDLLA